jgi:hypothetical protein
MGNAEFQADAVLSFCLGPAVRRIPGRSRGSEDSGSGAVGVTPPIDISIPSPSATYTLGNATSSIDVGGYVSESPYGKVQETVLLFTNFNTYDLRFSD